MSFMQGTQPEPSSDGEHDVDDGVKNEEFEVLEDDEPEPMTPVAYIRRGRQVGLPANHLAMEAAEQREIERLQNENARKFNAPRKGLKRLYAPDIDDELDSEDQPDLEEYFGNWHINPKDVVVICRSYASYVANKSKATKK